MSPHPPGQMLLSLISRTVRTDSGCLLWQGAITGKGYGQVRWNGRTHQAHRLAWELANGRTIPADLVGMHKCDTPACINPDHIEPGTHRDNAQDCVSKGRKNSARGESMPNHKLTSESVLAIVERAQSGVTYHDIAREFGVSTGLVGLVMNGYRWTHVTGFERRCPSKARTR